MPAKCLGAWLVLIATAIAETQATSDGLHWEPDLKTAQRLARESNRLVLIHFGGPWCVPCQQLEKQVFNQPGFGRALHKNYVAVKVDPRDNAELTAKYGVRAVPMDVVITPSGQVVYKLESPTTVAAYLDSMNRIAASQQSGVETAHTLASTPAEAKTEGGRTATNDATERYADYYRSRQQVATAQPNANPAAAHTENPMAQEQPRTTAVSMRQPTPGGTPLADSRSTGPRPQPKVITPSVKSPASQPKAPGNPPEALEGFCAVSLVEKHEWRRGDKRWGATHRGRTYLFANEEAQKTFLGNPDRYTPVLSGNDPVMRFDHNQDVPGKREHGAFYNDRIYLFASEDSFQQFERDPARYTVDTRQALRR